MRGTIASSLLLAGIADALIFPRNHLSTTTVIPLTTYNNQAYFAGVRMGEEGNAQKFKFQLSTTLGYTVVAGTGCTDCTAPGAPLYDPSKSNTFVAPPTGSSQVNVNINGVNFAGPLGIENCALQKQDDSWWVYNSQRVVVAGSDSDSNGFSTPGVSGVAGLGQSGVTATTDTLVGQYLAANSNETSITFAMALNGAPPTSGSGSDSDGGQLHMFKPDPSFYEGDLVNQPVLNQNQISSITGTRPNQISSYDWTVSMGGWSFQGGTATVAGGAGTFVTIEPAYPYMVLTQRDANNVYAALPGATTFSDPDTSTQVWSIPCSSTSGLSMNVIFGGVAIPVAPEDLFTRVGNTCVGNIRGWADQSRTTYVFGSAFLRNAYVVFVANNNPEQNTLGFGKRLRASEKAEKSQAGVIAGAVVGGVAFLALLGFGVWFYLRRKRQQAGAPSAAFLADSDMGHSTGKRSSFFNFGPKEKNVGNLVAEPWTPPPNQPGVHVQPNGDIVTVQPLSHHYGVDQPFLSPGAMSPALGGTQELQYDNRASYAGSTVAPSSGVLPNSPPPTTVVSDSNTAPSYYASNNDASAEPPNPYNAAAPNYRPDGNTTMWISSRGNEKK
ncbi:hypothetical protein FRC02_011074 [Tulasnella sp. 418]|nr:hypothetical protein FRC02_011074 [Tulasnella sp. 418]